MFCHLYWFAAATQDKFYLFKIQIFMLLKLESESAMQKIHNRIWNPNPPIFWPDCHTWIKYDIIRDSNPPKNRCISDSAYSLQRIRIRIFSLKINTLLQKEIYKSCLQAWHKCASSWQCKVNIILCSRN